MKHIFTLIALLCSIVHTMHGGLLLCKMLASNNVITEKDLEIIGTFYEDSSCNIGMAPFELGVRFEDKEPANPLELAAADEINIALQRIDYPSDATQLIIADLAYNHVAQSMLPTIEMGTYPALHFILQTPQYAQGFINRELRTFVETTCKERGIEYKETN